MSKLILLLGGTRSGKSKFAQELAGKSKTVTYLATALALDAEMEQRIAEHKKNRPKTWRTVELANQTIDACLENCNSQTVIIDCLGNLLTRYMEADKIASQVDDLPGTLEKQKQKQKFEQLIIVSNEVGLSLVSTYQSGRDFTDRLGLLNQNIAELAEEVYLVVAGLPIKIK